MSQDQPKEEKREDQRQEGRPATKMEIYEEKIAPLMRQIFDLCKEHKIALICLMSAQEEGMTQGTIIDNRLIEDEYHPAPVMESVAVLLDLVKHLENNNATLCLTAGGKIH